MDIKLKNKYFHIIAFVLCIYMMGFSLVAICDFMIKRHYVNKEPYFNSWSFSNELENYFEMIKAFHVDYKDFNNNSNTDKIDDEEIALLRERYTNLTNEKVKEIEWKYKKEIRKAMEGDDVEAKRLQNELDQEIAKIVEENVKAETKLRNEIISGKYTEIKQYINGKRNIKYFIKDVRRNELYTNLQKVSQENVEDYIRQNSLYSVKFPLGYNGNTNLRNLNETFKREGFRGYFIIPTRSDGFSQVHADYKYYNSLKNRVVKEGIAGLITLIVGFLGILFYMKQKTEISNLLTEKLNIVYKKIPIDIKILIFIIYTIVMNEYCVHLNFFNKPFNIDHILKLTVMAVYVFYIVLNIREIINFKGDKEKLNEQLKSGIIYGIVNMSKESFSIKGILFKVIVITTATIALFPAGVMIGYGYMDFAFIASWIYIIMYLIIIPRYIIKKIALLSRIIKGTDEIVEGNLDYVIEESGKGHLSRLAYNINNMKEGYKRSVENAIKSERLKSELITNVSHDLKTPLTSIINYINLLKKKDLSEEEMEGYIAVLDRKSERLKVLIEDLFEASKVSSGSIELNIEKIDVAALLRQALGEFDEKIKQSSLTYKVNIPNQEIYVNLDGKRTWRVFENLISNTLKYSQPGTRVYINMIETDSMIEITMKNIAAYEMDFEVEEIFDRFKRGDKSRSTEGSGLGLAIAKSIVDLQGGNMEINIDGDLFKAIVRFNK
ncbi:histidine kinase dimerization/phospho-acceptor domain-containing protein [Wukongibacter baidiensis]|uniref:sensor histidine kinase n=1 Tax=Wukongibacter baidiensis TaxID=1723361 RepID=UPI003D7F4E99